MTSVIENITVIMNLARIHEEQTYEVCIHGFYKCLMSKSSSFLYYYRFGLVNFRILFKIIYSFVGWQPVLTISAVFIYGFYLITVVTV